MGFFRPENINIFNHGFQLWFCGSTEAIAQLRARSRLKSGAFNIINESCPGRAEISALPNS